MSTVRRHKSIMNGMNSWEMRFLNSWLLSSFGAHGLAHSQPCDGLRGVEGRSVGLSSVRPPGRSGAGVRSSVGAGLSSLGLVGAFGGAGAAHAVEFARELGASTVVVPLGDRTYVFSSCPGTIIKQVDIPPADVWFRDYGPIFVKRDVPGTTRAELAMTKWRFNAWGDKYPPYDLDNQIPPRIARKLLDAQAIFLLARHVGVEEAAQAAALGLGVDLSDVRRVGARVAATAAGGIAILFAAATLLVRFVL